MHVTIILPKVQLVVPDVTDDGAPVYVVMVERPRNKETTELHPRHLNMKAPPRAS